MNKHMRHSSEYIATSRSLVTQHAIITTQTHSNQKYVTGKTISDNIADALEEPPGGKYGEKLDRKTPNTVNTVERYHLRAYSAEARH